MDGSPDMARALTARGHKQAQAMANFLRKHLPADPRVLVSPATRTRQTAAMLTPDFTLVPELAPGAGADAMLSAAAWPQAGGCTLIVGHQPTLGEVAARLLGCSGGLSVRKGSVWWFNHRVRADTVQTTLRLVLSPEQL